MKTLKNWLDDYAQSHQNPINKNFHRVCVPLIVFSVYLALRCIPGGTEAVNAATVSAGLALAYYARLSWQLAVGMALIFWAMFFGIQSIYAALGLQSLWVAAGVFVAAWVGQFIGHEYEGAKPSFFKDLQFLMIGPLWLLADLYRRAGLPMGPGARPLAA